MTSFKTVIEWRSFSFRVNIGYIFQDQKYSQTALLIFVEGEENLL